jgi:hypothetical protein
MKVIMLNVVMLSVVATNFGFKNTIKYSKLASILALRHSSKRHKVERFLLAIYQTFMLSNTILIT